MTVELVNGPALLAGLAAFFPSLCTIQEPGTPTTDSYGSKTYPWPTLAGHTDIPCRIAPIASLRQGESRRADMTVTTATLTVALAGYYPTVTSAMQAVIAGVTYNILDVKHDGSSVYTTLQVERVTT